MLKTSCFPMQGNISSDIALTTKWGQNNGILLSIIRNWNKEIHLHQLSNAKTFAFVNFNLKISKYKTEQWLNYCAHNLFPWQIQFSFVQKQQITIKETEPDQICFRASLSTYIVRLLLGELEWTLWGKSGTCLLILSSTWRGNDASLTSLVIIIMSSRSIICSSNAL